MKNAAGILFNENTELIVEADPDGTVTSCRNLKNNTEYVGGGGGSSDFSTAEVTFINSAEDTAYNVYIQTDDVEGFLYIGVPDNAVSVDSTENYTVKLPFPADGALVISLDSIADDIDTLIEPIVTGGVFVDGDGNLIIAGDGSVIFAGVPIS